MRKLWAIVLIAVAPVLAQAEVTRVEIASETEILNGSYEQLVGKIYFAVDPKNARNQVITDIDRATKNASGKVEMSADIKILKPKDPAKSNNALLIDIVNRGTETVNT